MMHYLHFYSLIRNHGHFCPNVSRSLASLHQVSIQLFDWDRFGRDSYCGNLFLSLEDDEASV